MGRRTVIPDELTLGPFTVADARRAGVDYWHLRGANWKRLFRGTYVWAGLQATQLSLLTLAQKHLPASAVFSGLTAGWLHGIDVAPCDPIEVTVPPGAGISARAGMRVYRAALDDKDVALMRGLKVTTMARTIADLSARLSLTEAVVIADAALHARRITVAQLNAWAAAHPGRRFIKRLRRVIDLAEPASESPMESRLRMVLVLAGLPRPKAQVSLYDSNGRFVGRPDLYYEEARLGIEYDGAIHRTTLPEDNRRQNKLLNAGIRLLRFTAGDVHNPASVVIQVRAALATAAPAISGRSLRGTATRSALRFR